MVSRQSGLRQAFRRALLSGNGSAQSFGGADEGQRKQKARSRTFGPQRGPARKGKDDKDAHSIFEPLARAAVERSLCLRRQGQRLSQPRRVQAPRTRRQVSLFEEGWPGAGS